MLDSDRPIDPTRACAEFAGLPPVDAAALASTLDSAEAHAGDLLFDPAAPAEALVIVLAGRVEAVETSASGVESVVRVIGPGEALDEAMLLAGQGSELTLRVVETCRLARVTGAHVDRLVGEYPALRAARERMRRRQLLCRLHALFGPVDGALLDDLESMADWVRLRRGELLYEQRDGAHDGVYFVVSGRVRTLAIDRDGTWRTLGEAGCGDSVGESSVLGVATRDERVQAMRDSVLVGFTSAEFDHLIARRPPLLRRVAGSVVRRMQRAASERHDGVISTIAVVPAGTPEPLTGFCERLVAELSKHGPTLWLDAEGVDARMREPGIAQSWDDESASEHLLAWLETQERTHRFVVYQTDLAASAWTRRCLRQADRVLYVARATGDPALGPIEAGLRELDAGRVQAHATLVLVHPAGRERPSGTRRWLAAREVDDHFHMRWTLPADAARLARMLAGRAVTLVLGGGGARGFAHIGTLRALDELGVPVDAICGTSMGASIAAQYAMGWTNRAIVETNRLVWVKLHPHTKLTLPVLSIVGNEESTRCGELLYGDADIEDLWLPYFCVSSNLATADMMVHRSGSLLWAATASASLPGFAVPVLHGDQLLVDGALLDNVPTEVARRAWGGFVIAAEVSVEEDAAFRCSRIPTKWEMVRSRVLGDAAGPRFPSFLEVAMRAVMLHSVYREKAALALADLRIRPAIERFGLMDFARLDEIVQAGYDSASETLGAWVAAGGLRPIVAPLESGAPVRLAPTDRAAAARSAATTA